MVDARTAGVGSRMSCTKGMRTARFAAPAAALLLAGVIPSAFAVRPQSGPAGDVRRAPVRHLPAREKSADQILASEDAARGGLSIRWDEEQGAPSRVQGNISGQSDVLSKGRALTAVTGSGDEGRAHEALIRVGRLFGFRDVAKEFRTRSSRGDALGFRHVRMAQRHEGLRVVGGELIVHFGTNGVYEINGRYVTGLPATQGARLTPADAVRVARDDLGDSGFKAVKAGRAAELVVFAVGQPPALAYEIRLSLDTPGSVGSWMCWVDALNGDVLLRCSDLRTIAAPTSNGVPATITGSMVTGEGGSVTNVTGWLENGGMYYLHSTQRWWQVLNYSTVGTYSDKGTYAYRAVNNWGTSDRAEVSLAHAFEKVQRYYFDMFGTRSFDGVGGMSRANVHYGNNYVNAFWDTDTQAFYFGDGDGMAANALVVLDIAGHEYAHAVAENTAGFVYSHESGALDESFADISGASVELLTQRNGRGAYPSRIAGRSDWFIGEDCWLSSVALRDMRSPGNTATVGAGNEQPSRYLGRYWYSGTGDSGGVHYNSGVQNFFYYLLSEGGSGVNDGLPYSVTGIGVENAARVAYRTVTSYCIPSTGYSLVRDAWMSAAADLNPAWVTSVDVAWNAVGLGSLGISPGLGLRAVGPVGGPFAPIARTHTLTNSGVLSLSWTASHSQPWLSLSSAGGSLPGGAGTGVVVSLNSAVDALGQGTHSDTIVFSNSASGQNFAVVVTVSAGIKDFATEVFAVGDNDLDGYMLTFRPDGVTTSYAVMAERISGYPTDPAGGTSLALGDDANVLVILPGGKRVRLFGVEYDRFHVGSNGYITFGAGDNDMSESLADHFDLPRISALFDDLNPAGLFSSQVHWKMLTDRVVVTYDHVPEYASTQTNDIQVEMFFDGTIRLAYPRLSVKDGLAGLSPGGGVPGGFVESDLNSYGAPPVLIVNPTSFNFGTVQAGTTREAVLAVTNAGECALQGEASVTGVFAVVSGASYYLVPGTTHVVRVRYSPQDGGVHSNGLVFTDGGGAECVLTGRAIGNADGDGDGLTDWEEYLAGTSASDASDYFRIAELLNGGYAQIIFWNSITGRWYTVSASTNLSGSWLDIHTASGTGTEMRYTNSPSGAQVDFLRVRVDLGP